MTAEAAIHEPIFEARGLSKSFHQGRAKEVRALCDVSLAVARQGFCALAGPSGSGKTTLLALLGALDRPSRGQVLFNGRDLTGCSDVELARCRRRMGFVFQDFSLIGRMPAWENVTYPLIPRGMRPAERREIARKLLEQFGMLGKLFTPPEEMSGGEQQRVALARALAGKPEVLLADEPTSNLDRRASQALCELLREIHAQGTTIVVASLDADVISLATTVYRLEEGRLEANHTGRT
jgi:putative ABC transport system ATP-binding protein